MSDIVTRLRGIDGFGWQCGQPLKDKGGYWRCSCGCSQPADDWDGSMTITQPAILRESANAIERLTVERDDARREVCELKALNFDRVIRPEDYALLRKWDCFEVKQ